MVLSWDNAQSYSNLAPTTQGTTSPLPGFWFGSLTAPSDIGSFYNNTLNANAQLSNKAPVHTVAMNGGTRITAAGDTALATVTLPNENITGTLTLAYVGQFSYDYVYPDTPAKLAEFQVTGVSFTDQYGNPVDPSSYADTAGMASAAQSGKNYLYVQLLPPTGAQSVTEKNPATPGSPVTLSSNTWNYSTDVPDAEIACFLSGAMITTADGPKAIENLKVGDLVMVGTAEQKASLPVTWIGRGHVSVQPHLPDDQAGYAVCILKGALGPNLPNADLRLTAEHTLYFQGRLVPVRMLVNARSIFYDKTCLAYDYYHFETEGHSLVLANNLLTESYLDTGHRASFEDMAFLQPAHMLASSPAKTWKKDACVPLGVSVDFVFPLYEAFDNRAKQRGLARQTAPALLTSHSQFHLVTDQNEPLYEVRRVRDRVMFLLPAGVRSVRLVSRTSRPCDTMGPYVDDRRHLGVLVGAVELYQNGYARTLQRYFTDPHASGWDVVEGTPCRWTNGNALLELETPTAERDMLAIQLLSEGPYLASTPAPTPTIALSRSRALP